MNKTMRNRKKSKIRCLFVLALGVATSSVHAADAITERTIHHETHSEPRTSRISVPCWHSLPHNTTAPEKARNGFAKDQMKPTFTSTVKPTLTLLTALLLAGMAFGELAAVVATAAQPAGPDARGPAMVPGLVGKAFLVDSPEHEFSFHTRDRFQPAQGTVEFWVQPKREIGAEDFEGVLYRTIDPLSSSQGIQVIFYRRGVLVNTKSKTGWDLNHVFPVRFAARSWHHLALSWVASPAGFTWTASWPASSP